MTRQDRIRELVAKGWTAHQIAADVGATVQRVREMIWREKNREKFRVRHREWWRRTYGSEKFMTTD